MAAGQGLRPAGGRAGLDSPGDAGRLIGGAWLAALPDELAGQRHVMAGLAERCQVWALARSLLVGCSLGRDGRGDLVVTADGGLAGPFNAFVTAPGAGRRLASLGATLRFRTSIERRLSEIAIITIGARWQAEFEWWAHAPMAREHGVADAVVGAIGRGEDPPFEADDERAVYTAVRQLGRSGRLDQETYDAAHRFLGDAGMVELVSLCGYYTLVSFLLNAFVVPLPPDATPMWAGS